MKALSHGARSADKMGYTPLYLATLLHGPHDATVAALLSLLKATDSVLDISTFQTVIEKPVLRAQRLFVEAQAFTARSTNESMTLDIQCTQVTKVLQDSGPDSLTENERAYFRDVHEICATWTKSFLISEGKVRFNEGRTKRSHVLPPRLGIYAFCFALTLFLCAPFSR